MNDKEITTTIEQLPTSDLQDWIDWANGIQK
jgi:hypothetical protein